jgi:hypothetical protein
MAIKFDNIEAESLLNSQGELTITLTDDQGITVPGAVQSASVTATGTVQGSYVTANNTSGAADGSAQEVARFVNTRSAATSGYIYIGAASGTDWRLGKNINGTAGNTNFGITKHSGTDIYLEIDGSGNTSILGDVFSDGLYVNSTSAVSGTQVAIVQDGNQNLQRWGSSSDGTTQASYRFRIDQNFKFIGNSGGGDTLTLDSTNGSATFTGSISASNFSGSSSGTNTGDQDLSSYLTTVSFSDLTGKPTTLSGYGIIDGASLGLDQVFTGDTEFEADLLRTNQRISNNQEYPLGHYTPGETVFELNTTWSNRELRQYFGNDNVSWDEVANAPGGYAVYIDGSVSVGGAYGSGFPYIPIDQDGIYYMECWIKNAGTAQGHYMGSIDYEADFTHPSSGGGNPGSYGYFVMSNYTSAAEWTKVSGYITGHHNSNTGAFETDATYWTPQALFNYSAGTGTRACWISGWKVIRVDHVGDRTFQDDVKVKGKLEVHTLDANTTSTTALVMNANEVEKRTLGSNAFNSTSFLTSVDFIDIGGTPSSTGGATRTNYDLGFKPAASSYAGFRFYGADGNNAGYFLIRGTSDNDVYAANGITLVGDQGWLTFAHRYSSDKGIRFMTGNTSASTRMSIASDGDININNSLTVGSDLAVNGFIKDGLYKHAGDTSWRTKKYVRSVGITGGEINNSWVQLSRVTIGSSYEKVTIKFTINGYDDVSSGVEAIDVRYENGNSAQENHQMAWYSTDDHANLFKNVRSIRSSSSGLSNTYDLYVQMAGDWRDSFTVVAESWTTHASDSPITYITAAGSANEPSAGSNDIERTERRWYTENSFMYLGANRVYTTGDFATSDFTYSAGTLLDLSSNTFNVDLSELTNNTATFAPTQDHFVILDNGVQAKKLGSSIFGSAAYEASSAFAAASHNHNGVYLSTSGGEISKSTNTTGTDGTTLLTLTNDVGGDISQQQTFIDFKFTDTNQNFTPQVRIGAQVGRDADADAISKEGAGAFVVYTGNGTDEGGSGSLTEAFRVSYNGNATVAGSISADNLVDATTSASGFMSSTDKTKLDGIESGADVTDSTNVATAGALMATGGILSGTVKVTGSIIHEHNSNSGYIAFPKGGMYHSTANAHTGAIKIKLPTHGGDDMLKFTVDIYDYATDESVTILVSGYIYQASGGNEWTSCTAINLAHQSAKNYTVRFGGDGSNSCVWIGETTSTWNHLQVAVTNFWGGFYTDVDAYDDNWEISVVTDFGDHVDEVRTNNFPAADYNKIINKPSLFDGAYSSLSGLPTLGTASASAATDFISATSADTAAELITFAKGITTDGNSKFYNWRALDNTSSTSNSFWRIARITSSQSSRFMITLAGRSTSYSDNSLPAMGHIVGQLNNDNNYDVVFYNHSTASSEVVSEVGIVNVTNTVVDVYVKAGQYAELTATGHISDGSFAVYSNNGSDGNTSVDGYVTVTEYTVMNTGNSDVLYKSGGTMSGDILLGTNSIAADATSPTAHIQVGAGTSNTSNRSDVALLGDANAGGVVNALGLVNTATAANSNGVALNFHNANNYSPTGQILLQQNSSGTTTHSAMKFFTYGSNNLTHQMSIKSDGTIRFLSYGAGFIKSDSSGNLSVDTSTYLTGIAAKSVGIAELNVTDGSAGQVLTTDGDGTLSFATVSSGGSYTLPAATSSALGGVKIGYTANAKNYPVQLDASNKAYVNVPWTDANTTYSAGSGLDLSSNSFSVEADLRDGITHVGKDANNYIQFDSTNGRIDFYAGGNFVARMESDGDLHIKGDVIAFSNIFG